MSDQFSILEDQFLRACLATKTDEEIAEILEKPVEAIRARVHQITGGDPDQRNQRVLDVKAIIEEQKRNEGDKRRKKEQARLKRQQDAKERHSLKQEAERKRREKQMQVDAVYHSHQKQRIAREARMTFKTKDVDWSQMRSVRVSRNTIIMVPKGVSAKKAIEKYYANLENKERSSFGKELGKKIKAMS